MRLLIITQKVDRRDPGLGFFHHWIAEFSKKFESIAVICLEKGEYDLPKNVSVFSLGKEYRPSRLHYLAHFYRYIWQERNAYDAVFVHMNQEYIILGGLFWKLLGKDVYLWRNHHAGTFLTDMAALLCTNIFCTSKFSYTARFPQTLLMPVGVDTELFKVHPAIARKPRSILFLARIAPVKKPDLLLRVLKKIQEKNIAFTASIYGDPLPKDREYYESLKKYVAHNALGSSVTFHPGIPNEDAPRVYSAHDIFVNLSSSGMYDKTIFEAMATESLVLASNDNLRGLIPDEFIFSQDHEKELEAKLTHLLTLSDPEKKAKGVLLRRVVIDKHSLSLLAEKLSTIMS